MTPLRRSFIIYTNTPKNRHMELERNTASEYHQLGVIAQERKQFDEAEKYYRKALEICKRLKLEQNVAYEYHNLGINAQERKQFDEAEKYHRKALKIFERLKLEQYVVGEYDNLGK